MSLQKHLVSRDDSRHEGWPDLVMTKSGKLICIFTECIGHGDRTGSRLAICESTDRGRNWSQKRYLTEIAEGGNYYNNARISRLHDDSLVVVCDMVYGDETKDAQVFIWFSDCEGSAYDGPYATPAVGIVPDKLLELESGRWLLTVHFRNKINNRVEQYLWYSDDRGKNWSEKIVVAADDRYDLCEASILPVDDKTLVAFLRENSGLGYDCMKTISYDCAEHWSEVYNVPIPACHRPVSGWLQNGNVMITHRFMQGGKGWLGSWTQNVFAAFLNKEGVLATERNQQSTRIFPLDFDRSPQSDLGYTGWVQFEDGEIYVVTYIVDDAPKAQIRGYSFRMEDVILEA